MLFCSPSFHAQAAEVGFLHSFLTSPASAGPLLLGPLYQILSLGLSAAAVTNYVQSGGARTDTLDSDVHKRLNASLSTFSIAQLALLVGVWRLGWDWVLNCALLQCTVSVPISLLMNCELDKDHTAWHPLYLLT
jgi:hypothetical protein